MGGAVIGAWALRALSLSLVVFVYYLVPPFWEHLCILVRHFSYYSYCSQ